MRFVGQTLRRSKFREKKKTSVRVKNLFYYVIYGKIKLPMQNY